MKLKQLLDVCDIQLSNVYVTVNIEPEGYWDINTLCDYMNFLDARVKTVRVDGNKMYIVLFDKN